MILHKTPTTLTDMIHSITYLSDQGFNHFGLEYISYWYPIKKAQESLKGNQNERGLLRMIEDKLTQLKNHPKILGKK
jgi:hypothetical protein